MAFRTGTLKGRSAFTVTAAALFAAICLSAAGSAGTVAFGAAEFGRPDDVSWKPVHTLYEHATRGRALVTTDSGLVVAAWSSTGSRSLFLSVRRGAGGWSDPTIVLAGGATSFQLAKDGRAAVVVAQGSGDVSVVEISGSGEIRPPLVVGSTSSSFTNGPVIGFGSDGAAAAVWKPTSRSEDVSFAFRSPSGEWQPQEAVPGVSGYPYGVVVDSAGNAGVIYTRAVGGGGIGIDLLERAADGTWGVPESIAERGLRPTLGANRNGDLVIAYTVGDETGATAYVRYRPSGRDFEPPHILDETATIYQETPVAIADDGSAVATFGPPDIGGPAELVRADAAGSWSAPETVALRNYANTAMDAAGDLVLYRGSRFIRCQAGRPCGSVESMPHRIGSTAFTLGPRGAITVLGDSGCSFRGCGPFRLRVERGR